MRYTTACLLVMACGALPWALMLAAHVIRVRTSNGKGVVR